MRKGIALLCACTMLAGVLAGCGNAATTSSSAPAAPSQGAPASTPASNAGTDKPFAGQTLNAAVLESAYGTAAWQEVAAAFEEVTGAKVELTMDKFIEDIISPNMKAGDYPDVVHLATGRPKAMTETLIKEKALLDITDVLGKTIPGETGTVKDKIIPGFTDTSVTNPYGDGKTFLAPMFYGPCGLFYNAGLFKAKGWEVPKNWDEMWALGDKAKAEGIYLFTYPTTGYFDAFFYSLMNEVGGADFFNKVTNYEEGVWDSEQGKQMLDLLAKLATYTEPTTVANANNENFLKNQQLILDNKALFMPNGTWVVGEMSEATRADGFEWGFTAVPAVTAGGDSYSYTFYEQIWVPAQAKNPDLAKEFVAFMYSDRAVEIFLNAKNAEGKPSPAVQPVKGVDSKLEGDNKLFYSIYNDGAKPAMGVFTTTAPVEGVSMADALFGTFNSIVSGDKTVDQWREAINKANDALRAALQ